MRRAVNSVEAKNSEWITDNEFSIAFRYGVGCIRMAGLPETAHLCPDVALPNKVPAYN